MIKKIDKIIAGISRGISIVTYVAFIGVMAIIAIDVIGRKVFQTGIIGSYEIVERMLLILIFGAFAYAQTARGHIHVTLFISKMPKAFGTGLFGVLGLLSAGTAVFCGYATLIQGGFSFYTKTTTSVLQIPLFPFFYIATFCMFVFALTLFWDAIKSLIGTRNEEAAENIRSSWD